VLKRVPLGEFRPDLPPSDQLIVATNVRPSPTGYLPVASFATITPALSGISGGAAFRSSTGETSFLGGDHNSLNRYSGVTWSSLIVALSADRWRFAQFGDNVIGVYGGQPVSYNLLTGTAALLTGNPPDADMVAVVRDFVVVAGDPASTLTVSWSGSNDSTEWTPLENQSDSQPMLDGGEVMGLAGGEYGVVLQRNAIKRMTYQGGEVIFSFDEISSNTGCMAKGSVTQAGRLVFFLSERGFMICDGNDVRPIGEDKVDRTFFATYSRQDIEAGIYAAVDPARNVVMWSMPGSPGMLWCYYWSQERWATIETDVRLLFSGFTANIGLEAVSVLYPDLDTMPVSLDDPKFAGGNPLLLIATTGGVVGTLAGPALPATLAIARSELAPGRCRIRAVRPMTDAVNVTIRIEGRARGGATPLVETFGQMRQNGEVPVRVNAQTFAITTAIRGPWTYIQSLDVDYEPAGRR
jgi:hypothetical protein